MTRTLYKYQHLFLRSSRAQLAEHLSSFCWKEVQTASHKLTDWRFYFLSPVYLSQKDVIVVDKTVSVNRNDSGDNGIKKIELAKMLRDVFISFLRLSCEDNDLEDYGQRE